MCSLKKKEKECRRRNFSSKAKEVEASSVPKQFLKVMAQLSKPHRELIKEAGFGGLLRFTQAHVPNEMTVNVVWFYDPYNNWFNLVENKILTITEDDVHKTLGFPKGI